MAAFETPNLENCWKTNFGQSVRIHDNNLPAKGYLQQRDGQILHGVLVISFVDRV
jgi:hypothetical protein